MIKNFTVDQENAVICDGVLFDLHNCYDIESIKLTSDTLSIHFDPHELHGAGNPRLTMTRHGLECYTFMNEQSIASVEYLDRIGYAAPDQSDLCSLLSESQSDTTSHLVLDFDICTIRFYGEKCVISI